MVRNFLSEAKWLNASLKASCGHHPRGPSPNKVCILTSRKMEQKMKAELDDRKRDFLLGKLRVAVRLQIKLWDVAAAIEELAACELQEVLDFVNAAAITAETGMELSSADLDEFLKIGIPGRISTGAVSAYCAGTCRLFP